MNRRDFLNWLGKAAVGGAVAYSFPKVIVPKNIVIVENVLLKSRQFGCTTFSSLQPISFELMERVYREAQNKMGEPKYILANEEFYSYFREVTR